MAKADKKTGFNLEEVRVDATKESDGVEVEIFDDLYVTLRPLPNDDYDDYVQANTRGINFGRKKRLTKSQLARMEPVVKHAVAKFVVVNWRGMLETDQDDIETEVEFSVEKCLEYFEKYPKFYTEIFEVARDDGLFVQDQLDEQAGNS